MSDEYTELERLAKEATPGPWIATDSYVWQRKGQDGLGPCLSTGYDCELSKQDAAYIAACSPEVLLKLIQKARDVK